jgi:hypothetical protein
MAEPATWTWRESAALAACLALGLLNLWNPFTYDQALFAMGGDRLLHGARLYRDVWDLKQPGIFWFFALGIRLFGLSEEGVHLLELLVFTAFAAVLLRTLPRAFDRRWGAPAAALLIVGFYWAITRDWHQTQPEGLVGFPLFVSLWFALEASRGARGAWGRWMLAGLAAGIVGVFKMLLVVLPGLFWIVLLGAGLARSRLRLGDAGRAVAALSCGFAIPVGSMLAVLGAQGVLPAAWFACVVYPSQVNAQIHGLPLGPWGETMGWFFHRWRGVLALALVGAWTSWRGRHGMLTRLLVLWIVAGTGLLLMQRFSGWEYHLMVLLVPFGILAARGLESFAKLLETAWPAAAARERAVVATVALAALLASPLSAAMVKAGQLVEDRFVTSREMRARHMLRVSRHDGYARSSREADFVRAPGARPGPIYVIGDPLVCWLAGRRSSVPRDGGILFHFTTRDQWAAAARRLEETGTPYVFVESPRLRELASFRPRSDPMLRELAARYRLARESPDGTWFERAEAR